MSVHDFGYAGHSLTGVDEFGSEWVVEAVSGWGDGVGIRATRESRAGQDGEWDTTPLRQAREITWTGKVLSPDHAALELSGRLFTSLPLRGEAFGESEGLTLSARAYISDAPKFAHLSDGASGAWQLTVVSPDPLLYGPATVSSTNLSDVAGTGLVYPLAYPLDYGVPAGTTPGSIAVNNAGTASYWPVLRVDGPVPNPVITLNETGDWIRYNGTLAAGQWLDIDCGARRVLLNGQVSQSARMTFSGRWLTVPVGGGSISWNADSADPAASLTVIAREGAWQ